MRMAQKQFYKLILLVVQPHFIRQCAERILSPVKRDISKTEFRRRIGTAAPGKGADTGKKLTGGEGLWEIIVRTGIQSGYPVCYLRLCRQKQGRCGISLCTGSF